MTQAIILAAGESSRFKPLSEGRHKSLLKLMGKALIEWTVESVVRGNVKDIIVVCSQNDEKTFKQIFKQNKKIKIVAQPEPKGMGNALQCAQYLIKEDFFVVNAADKFDSEVYMKQMIAKQKKTKSGMVLLSCKTGQPWKYGMLGFKGDKALQIVEKPEKGKEPSNYKVVSIYLLPKEFPKFLNVVKEHQYSFEDALQTYMNVKDARVVFLTKETPSTKYPWELLDVSKNLLLKEGKKLKHKGRNVQIAKNVVIEGNVWIGSNVKIFENAVIKGPAYIGDNCVIGNNALIRDFSVLENGVQIGANTEVARAIIMENTHIHSGFIGDSVIGENCRIGAGFVTANRRTDRKEIEAVVKGEKVSTGKTSMGAIIGHNTKIGIKASSMPGAIVGANCVVGANTQVSGNIGSGTTVYSKFEMIVEKKNDSGKEEKTDSNKKRIVVIGGGNGTQAAFKGLAKNPNVDLSVIVSMFDSGGSTGKLRKAFGIPAVGDIRRCFVALRAENEKTSILKDLFGLRFDKGELNGHNLGNLILVGLLKTSKTPEEAWEKAGNLFDIQGKVCPSSIDNSSLVAEFENGKVAEGEALIDVPEKDGRDPKLHVVKLYSKPEAKAFYGAIKAIEEADMIVIGPGDMYTSVLANFTAVGLKETLQKSKAKKVYVCNALTKPGETYGFSVSDHAKEILKHTGLKKLDFVIANSTHVAREIVEKHAEVKGQEQVRVDADGLKGLAGKAVLIDLVGEKEPTKHDAEKLAKVLLQIANQ